MSGRLEINRFVQVVSEKPAQIGCVDQRKGQIAPGKDADLVFWNPKSEWKVSKRSDFSRNDTSPYQNWKLKGKVTRTYVRGKPVWQDGEIVAPDGWGVHLPSEH